MQMIDSATGDVPEAFFKTACFNRSHIPPRELFTVYQHGNTA
jgi:hypothetical protein